MSTLSDLFASISDALKAVPGWSGLAVRIGAKFLANNEDPPPRMVWVLPRPGDETFGPPNLSVGPKGNRGRTLRTRIGVAEVHLLAVDDDATERLSHDLISTIHKTTRGSFELISGGYLSENESGWAQFGSVYVLRVSFVQPITETPLGTAASAAKVTEVQMQSEVEDPATGTPEVDVPYPP